MRQALSLVSCLFAGSVVAQTFVVDVANGPGTSFTQIAAAVAAVPDGAVLLVRPGAYQPFTVTAKSLKVLADPGTRVLSSFLVPDSVSVTSLQVGQSVVLRNLTLTPGFPTLSSGVRLADCQGSVIVENLTLTAGLSARFLATDCAQVMVRGVDFADGFLRYESTDSDVSVTSSRIGRSALSPLVGGPALRVTGGAVQLVDCDVAALLPFGAPAPAVQMTGGSLRLLGATTLASGPAVPPEACVSGTGFVRFDTGVSFVNGPAFAATITSAQQAMPALVSSFAAGLATSTLTGPTGDLGVLAVALPGTRISLPGALDPVWLDAATMFPVAFGVFGAASPVVGVLTPPSGAGAGIRVVWQGLSLDAAGVLQVSNASPTILP